MIEVREEGTHEGHSTVLIRCAESGGAGGVARGVDLALLLGHTKVVVDLGQREVADADFLSVLHGTGQRMRDAGGRLALVCADSRLRRLFDITLLSRGLSVYETEEEALAA